MDEFVAAVAAYELVEVPLELGRVADAPLLVVGEPHGAEETARVIWTLLRRGGFERLALEWPQDELAPIACDPRRLRSLPATAEARSGEGRFSAGLFALVAALSKPPLLLDLSGEHGSDRGSWLFERLTALRSPSERTLVLVGAAHAAALHERGLPAVLLGSAGGRIAHRGVHELGELPFPPSIPRLRLGVARPAVVAS